MEARAARFDEEDQLKKLRAQKVQERNAKLNALNSGGTSSAGPKEPACWGMCPEFEMIDRQVTNDVSLFEAQIPFNPPQGKLIIDPKRAVKKFRRSAAGNYELAEDLRPPEVLLATTVYLMRNVLGDTRWPANNVPFSVQYAFIRDRLRAIRTDLTLQNCKNISSIRIHELSIRFLIAAGHWLCEEERAAFEPQQNNEQLNGCLSALREMYKAVRFRLTTQSSSSSISSSLLKHEAEFQAYSIILSVDKKEAAVAISSLPVDLLRNESIQVALEAFSAFQHTNYIKFLHLIGTDRRTSYLQACLLHQFVLPVRQRGLTAMVSLSDTFKLIPKADLIRWLGFVDEDELIYYSGRFGFKIFNNSNNSNNFNNFNNSNNFNNFNNSNSSIDLSSLINRGEAFDLKAEEENFKIRKFQKSIEEQRRGVSTSLSEKMFEEMEMDLDLDQVMKVLEGGNKIKLTSEFLAASTSTSSPLPKNASIREISKHASEIFPKPPLTPTSAQPVIDHQAILRRKLEAQAQERQVRKEMISHVSEVMLETLIDSIVGFQVSESCTLAWEHLYQEQKENRTCLIENLSKKVLEDILNLDIFPVVLDVELMKIRCKAAESLESKTFALTQSTFTILSQLEREIYEETVLESFLEFKGTRLFKKFWFDRMKKRSPIKHFDISTIKIPSIPVHLLFIGNSKLLEQLLRLKLTNNLGYLQSFLKMGSGLKMIWSSGNFILSHLRDEDEDKHKLCLFDWPQNYPGPTVILTTETTDFEINSKGFPWQPEIVNIGIGIGIGKDFDLIEVINFAIKKSEFVHLPPLNQNLLVSHFVSEEFLESFVIEPFRNYVTSENFETETSLLFALIEGLIEKIVWILFKNPNASKLLSFHPITSGRSFIIDSLRKSQTIPETFVSLFKASKSFKTTLTSIDQIYGNIFTTNLENLYTNQSISEIIQSQNEIISNFTSKKRTKLENTFKKEKDASIDGLKEKLRTENLESEAYEKFLKKFL